MRYATLLLLILPYADIYAAAAYAAATPLIYDAIDTIIATRCYADITLARYDGAVIY